MSDYSGIRIDEQHDIAVQMFVHSQPTPSWFLRLPIIRHVRALIARHKVERHYDFWYSHGSLPLYKDFDEAVIDAIWRGEK